MRCGWMEGDDAADFHVCSAGVDCEAGGCEEWWRQGYPFGL